MAHNTRVQRFHVPIGGENVGFVAAFGEKIGAFEQDALDAAFAMTSRKRKRDALGMGSFADIDLARLHEAASGVEMCGALPLGALPLDKLPLVALPLDVSSGRDANKGRMR